MEAFALSRLRHLGEVFTSGGEAAQALGKFLQNPDPDLIPGCFSDVANHFLMAASACDALKELSAEQDRAGLGHGYSQEDSAALATFASVFEGFAACVVFISALDFTGTHEEKQVLWEQVSAALKTAAEASWRQMELMRRALPEQDANPDPGQQRNVV